MTKTCTKCGEEKVASEFWPQRRQCKKCAASASARRYVVNRDKVLKVAALWRKNNAEHCKAYQKANRTKINKNARDRRAKNPEGFRKRRREHFEANREKIYETTRLWKAANKEKVAESKRPWAAANPRKIAEYNRRWFAANKGEVAKKSKRRADELADVYVKDLIAKRSTLTFKDIPDSLVRLKRAQIKLLREVKKHGDQERGPAGGQDSVGFGIGYV